ncbi:ABC transporter ATP-binding protein [Aquamicrobium ahrensii]|uniref:Oligopeptide/dipeptide ABC transporter ATP-binding protein n=1 Tax=Aquamicrobium ahrensii TaxID=469551 RepID=A0ABV2KRT6_9HYPH
MILARNTDDSGPDSTQQTALSVKDLRLSINNGPSIVDGVSFDIPKGKVLGLVGESGCGKSLTALSILRLTAPVIRSSGRIFYQGEDLLAMDEERIRRIRGGEVAMIFQEPMTSLNPVFTIGDQIVEAVRTHHRVSAAQAREMAIAFLERVGIPSPQKRIDHYPHQLSGGMRQRAMIAMALVSRPRVLIADEPTTALDVTIQAQILDLLRSLQSELDMAILMITHDLGVVAELADEVVVMYAGRVVEHSTVAELFSRPLHPYTEGLLESVPPVDEDVDRLSAIPGVVPSFDRISSGCRFADRCRYVADPCRAIDPALAPMGPGHLVACIRHQGYRQC